MSMWQLDTSHRDEQAAQRGRDWRRDWEARHAAWLAFEVAQVEAEMERMFREDFGSTVPSIDELDDEIVDGYRKLARTHLWGGAS